MCGFGDGLLIAYRQAEVRFKLAYRGGLISRAGNHWMGLMECGVLCINYRDGAGLVYLAESLVGAHVLVWGE